MYHPTEDERDSGTWLSANFTTLPSHKKLRARKESCVGTESEANRMRSSNSLLRTVMH